MPGRKQKPTKKQWMVSLINCTVWPFLSISVSSVLLPRWWWCLHLFIIFIHTFYLYKWVSCTKKYVARDMWSAVHIQIYITLIRLLITIIFFYILILEFVGSLFYFEIYLSVYHNVLHLQQSWYVFICLELELLGWGVIFEVEAVKESIFY